MLFNFEWIVFQSLFYLCYLWFSIFKKFLWGWWNLNNFGSSVSCIRKILGDLNLIVLFAHSFSAGLRKIFIPLSPRTKPCRIGVRLLPSDIQLANWEGQVDYSSRKPPTMTTVLLLSFLVRYSSWIWIAIKITFNYAAIIFIPRL
jgi:hypothetical protein